MPDKERAVPGSATELQSEDFVVVFQVRAVFVGRCVAVVGQEGDSVFCVDYRRHA